MGKKKNNHNTNNHKANNKVSNKIETKTETKIETKTETKTENTQDTNLDEIDKMMEAELESAATAEEQSDIVKDESTITEEQPSVEDDTEIEMEIIDIEKPKKKKFYWSDLVRYAVMFVSLCLFSYAAYELTLIYINGAETEEVYDDISNMFMVNVDDNTPEYYNVNGDKIYLNNSGDGTAFVWDFEKVKELNPNAKGYIRQGDGTYIDNPIVQHPSDNSYYLTHLSNNYPGGIGSIFIDYRITEGLNAKNCIMYAHNVKEWAHNIMFGSLKYFYDDPAYCEANPTMDIYIDEHHYVYYVYSVFKVKAMGSDAYTFQFENDEKFMEYVEKFRNESVYQFANVPEINAQSHILTLSTCTTEEENRMIVQLVRGEEVLDVPVKTEDTTK